MAVLNQGTHLSFCVHPVRGFPKPFSAGRIQRSTRYENAVGLYLRAAAAATSVRAENKGDSQENAVVFKSLDGSGAALKTQEVPVYHRTSVVLSPAPTHLLRQFNTLSSIDQLFVVLGVLSCLTVGALLTALVTAIPTLKAIHRAALSVERLSNIAREELPGTMAAIRLSSMEISDLTLELNDLSQDISEGVRNSARAVQAAEVGIRRMGALAASQTFAMLQQRATVPVQAVKPVVATAAENTRQAVLQAQKIMLTLANQPQFSRWFWKGVDENEAEVESKTSNNA